jgi:WD40 repeat protein
VPDATPVDLRDSSCGQRDQLRSDQFPIRRRWLGRHYHIAISPDTKTIATVEDNGRELFLWSVDSRSQLPAPKIDTLSALALTWSHDGKTIAVGRSTDEKRGVLLYDVSARTQRIFATERDELIRGIAFSPDDKTLAVSYDSVAAPVRIWDVASGNLWQTLDEKRAAGVGNPFFAANGGVLAVDCSGLRPSSIRLFDVSKRPGASSATASVPPPLSGVPTQDDEMAAQIADAIRGTFDPRNVEALDVTYQPDGSFKLTDKASDEEIKRVAQRTAEVHHVPEEPWNHELNHIINELEVTGHLAPASGSPR